MRHRSRQLPVASCQQSVAADCAEWSDSAWESFPKSAMDCNPRQLGRSGFAAGWGERPGWIALLGGKSIMGWLGRVTLGSPAVVTGVCWLPPTRGIFLRSPLGRSPSNALGGPTTPLSYAPLPQSRGEALRPNGFSHRLRDEKTLVSSVSLFPALHPGSSTTFSLESKW